MTIQLDYSDKSGNLDCLIFCDEKYNPLNLNKDFKSLEIKSIKQFLKKVNLIDEEIVCFDLSPFQKIIFIKLIRDKLDSSIEKIGAKLFDFLKKNKLNNIKFLKENILEANSKYEFFLNKL